MVTLPPMDSREVDPRIGNGARLAVSSPYSFSKLILISIPIPIPIPIPILTGYIGHAGFIQVRIDKRELNSFCTSIGHQIANMSHQYQGSNNIAYYIKYN